MLQAPVASTTVRQRQSPLSVATAKPLSVADTDVTLVWVSTGAEITLRVAVEEIDDLGHGAVAVGIVAVIAEARQAALPVGRQQAKRVPAFGAPRIGHLAALDDDMLDRALGEAAAHRQPSMAGADHDSSYVANAAQLCDRAKAPLNSR